MQCGSSRKREGGRLYGSSPRKRQAGRANSGSCPPDRGGGVDGGGLQRLGQGGRRQAAA